MDSPTADALRLQRDPALGRGESDVGAEMASGQTDSVHDPVGVSAGFDMFVGGWISRTGDAEGVSAWLLSPILLLTLFFGPVGFLLFVILRLVRRRGAMVGA